VVPGHRLGDGLAVFHDCPVLDLTLAYLDQSGMPDAPPRGFAITVGQFTGSYFSFVVDLPEPVARGLTRQNIVSVRLALSGPTEIYTRLNLRHGPNTDAVVRKAAAAGASGTSAETDLRVDFDLAPVAFDADTMTAAWVDIIVSRPAGLRIEVRDIILSRRLRAML
jgi:hypothetical protein